MKAAAAVQAPKEAVPHPLPEEVVPRAVLHLPATRPDLPATRPPLPATIPDLPATAAPERRAIQAESSPAGAGAQVTAVGPIPAAATAATVNTSTDPFHANEQIAVLIFSSICSLLTYY
jgi:hypothetical protein